jgi:hypothetical protein
MRFGTAQILVSVIVLFIFSLAASMGHSHDTFAVTSTELSQASDQPATGKSLDLSSLSSQEIEKSEKDLPKVEYYADCIGRSPTSYNPTEPYVCVDPINKTDNGYYVGHDEPSMRFISGATSSANNLQWAFDLPLTDKQPTSTGSVIANYQLYATLWLGMSLCDPQSYPFGSCTPDSDANGLTAGSAFLELQFYPPGSILRGSSTTSFNPNQGWSVTANVFSFTNNANCFEPSNSIGIPMSGGPMVAGHHMLVTMKDTPSGLQITVADPQGGSSGSVVLSGANGFTHTDHNTCATSSFDYHPEFSTATENHYTSWAALRPNINMAFEIGHAELGSTKGDSDADDVNCFPMYLTCNLLFSGSGDNDFDGISYIADWPDGTASHPDSFHFTTPTGTGLGPMSMSTSSYDVGYPQFRFDTEHCFNTGCTVAPFYPFYSQTGSNANPPCNLIFGNVVPATTSDFGKSAQYGTEIVNPCTPGASTPTTLTLNTISDPLFGKTVTVSGKLTSNNAGGAGVGGQTITFTTSGGTIANTVTASDGTFSATGTASSTSSPVGVQAHYAGSSSFGASNSVTLSYNVIYMQDITQSTTKQTYSARQINAEFASSSSVLVGKSIHTMIVNLKKVGSPTGSFQIGVFNKDLSVKNLFATVDASSIKTTATDYQFSLPTGQTYLIQSGDRIGIKFTGGTSSNYIGITADTNSADPFDGKNSYDTYYTTSWHTSSSNDFDLTLK